MKNNSLRIIMGLFLGLSLLSTTAFTAEAPEAEAERITCPSRPDEPDLRRDLAGAWFEQGQAFAKEKLLVEALDAFLCSMTMYEHESTLHNVRKSAGLVEDKTVVIGRLEEYVDGAPEGPLTDKVQAMIDAEKDKIDDGKEEPAVGDTSISLDSAAATSGFNWKIPAYVAFGVGGLSLIQAIVWQSLAISKSSDADQYGEQGRTAEREREIFQTNATIGFVIAGVIGGGGVLLYLYEDKLFKRKQAAAQSAKPGEVANVRVLPSLGGLTLSGTF